MKFRLRKRDPYYVALLKFIGEKSKDGEGTNAPEAINHIRAAYPEISERAIGNIFFSATEQLSITDATNYVMTLDGYFQLLAHEELKQARKSSFVASWFALLAIAFAGVSILLQVYDPKVVLLNGEQIEEIIRLITEAT